MVTYHFYIVVTQKSKGGLLKSAKKKSPVNLAIYRTLCGERGSNIFVTKRSQLYSFISSWLRFLYIREYHLKPIVPNIKAENGYFFGYAIFHPRHKN